MFIPYEVGICICQYFETVAWCNEGNSLYGLPSCDLFVSIQDDFHMKV